MLSLLTKFPMWRPFVGRGPFPGRDLNCYFMNKEKKDGRYKMTVELQLSVEVFAKTSSNDVKDEVRVA